jgi:hypothetical protein
MLIDKLEGAPWIYKLVSHKNNKAILKPALSRLKQDSSIETTRFRQAVYLNWTRRMLIPDLLAHIKAASACSYNNNVSLTN